MDTPTPSAVIRRYNNTHYNKVEQQGVRRVTINSPMHLVLMSLLIDRGNILKRSLKLLSKPIFRTGRASTGGLLVESSIRTELFVVRSKSS